MKTKILLATILLALTAAAQAPINGGMGMTNNGACTFPLSENFAGIQICNDSGTLKIYNSNTGTTTAFPFTQMKVWMTCQGASTGDVSSGFSTSCQMSVKSIQ